MLPTKLAQQPQAPALKMVRQPEQSQPWGGEHPPRPPMPGEGPLTLADLHQLCPAVVGLPNPQLSWCQLSTRTRWGASTDGPALQEMLDVSNACCGGWLDPALAPQPPGGSVPTNQT